MQLDILSSTVIPHLMEACVIGESGSVKCSLQAKTYLSGLHTAYGQHNNRYNLLAMMTLCTARVPTDISKRISKQISKRNSSGLCANKPAVARFARNNILVQYSTVQYRNLNR